MKYGSVCSGVEAATVAWHPFGWKPQFFSEIEKFPSAVLEHHYPDVPNYGDMTNFKEWPNDPIDLLVGGTPCQSFSVAGLRKGLDDPRGNLMLTYLAIAARHKPKWVVWENVPGVLSSNRGRDFGTFLGALGELGYGFAYRVLDAQYFGVAQRRRRVFVVGYLGDWRRAAAVLFERESMSGHPAPSRETREEIAQCLTTRTGSAYDPTTKTLPVTTGALCARTGQSISVQDAAQSHLLPAAQAIRWSEELNALVDLQPTIQRGGAGGRHEGVMVPSSAVRRLTPIECERLQGFPDDYTQIAWRNKEAENCPDGPRYKAMGNSMAVPVMHWIGRRIQMVDAIQS